MDVIQNVNGIIEEGTCEEVARGQLNLGHWNILEKDYELLKVIGEGTYG